MTSKICCNNEACTNEMDSSLFINKYCKSNPHSNEINQQQDLDEDYNEVYTDSARKHIEEIEQICPFLTDGVFLYQKETQGMRSKLETILENYEKANIEGASTSILGKGSYGKVFYMKNKPTKKPVAMKIIEKKNIKDPAVLKSLTGEIEIHKRLLHDNIIRLYEHCEDERNIYLVMDYAAKGCLFQHIRKNHKLGEKEAFYYFTQACNAVHFLHKHNLVHRDIKPENMLITASGQLKLCDFGCCIPLASESRKDFCGTLEYMAPEVIMKQGYRKKSDVWSLGILLYEMLHGYSPFRGAKDKEIIKQVLECKLNFDENIKEDAREITIEMLKVDHKMRPNIVELFEMKWTKRMQKEFNIEDRPKKEVKEEVEEVKTVKIDDTIPLKKDTEEFNFSLEKYLKSDIPASSSTNSIIKDEKNPIEIDAEPSIGITSYLVSQNDQPGKPAEFDSRIRIPIAPTSTDGAPIILPIENNPSENLDSEMSSSINPEQVQIESHTHQSEMPRDNDMSVVSNSSKSPTKNVSNMQEDSKAGNQYSNNNKSEEKDTFFDVLKPTTNIDSFIDKGSSIIQIEDSIKDPKSEAVKTKFIDNLESDPNIDKPNKLRSSQTKVGRKSSGADGTTQILQSKRPTSTLLKKAEVKDDGISIYVDEAELYKNVTVIAKEDDLEKKKESPIKNDERKERIESANKGDANQDAFSLNQLEFDFGKDTNRSLFTMKKLDSVDDFIDPNVFKMSENSSELDQNDSRVLESKPSLDTQGVESLTLFKPLPSDSGIFHEQSGEAKPDIESEPKAKITSESITETNYIHTFESKNNPEEIENCSVNNEEALEEKSKHKVPEEEIKKQKTLEEEIPKHKTPEDEIPKQEEAKKKVPEEESSEKKLPENESKEKINNDEANIKEEELNVEYCDLKPLININEDGISTKHNNCKYKEALEVDNSKKDTASPKNSEHSDKEKILPSKNLTINNIKEIQNPSSEYNRILNKDHSKKASEKEADTPIKDEDFYEQVESEDKSSNEGNLKSREVSSNEEDKNARNDHILDSGALERAICNDNAKAQTSLKKECDNQPRYESKNVPSVSNRLSQRKSIDDEYINLFDPKEEYLNKATPIKDTESEKAKCSSKEDSASEKDISSNNEIPNEDRDLSVKIKSNEVNGLTGSNTKIGNDNALNSEKYDQPDTSNINDWRLRSKSLDKNETVNNSKAFGKKVSENTEVKDSTKKMTPSYEPIEIEQEDIGNIHLFTEIISKKNQDQYEFAKTKARNNNSEYKNLLISHETIKKPVKMNMDKIENSVTDKHISENDPMNKNLKTKDQYSMNTDKGNNDSRNNCMSHLKYLNEKNRNARKTVDYKVPTKEKSKYNMFVPLLKKELSNKNLSSVSANQANYFDPSLDEFALPEDNVDNDINDDLKLNLAAITRQLTTPMQNKQEYENLSLRTNTKKNKYLVQNESNNTLDLHKGRKTTFEKNEEIKYTKIKDARKEIYNTRALNSKKGSSPGFESKLVNMPLANVRKTHAIKTTYAHVNNTVQSTIKNKSMFSLHEDQTQNVSSHDKFYQKEISNTEMIKDNSSNFVPSRDSMRKPHSKKIKPKHELISTFKYDLYNDINAPEKFPASRATIGAHGKNDLIPDHDKISTTKPTMCNARKNSPKINDEKTTQTKTLPKLNLQYEAMNKDNPIYRNTLDSGRKQAKGHLIATKPITSCVEPSNVKTPAVIDMKVQSKSKISVEMHENNRDIVSEKYNQSKEDTLGKYLSKNIKNHTETTYKNKSKSIIGIEKNNQEEVNDKDYEYNFDYYFPSDAKKHQTNEKTANQFRRIYTNTTQNNDEFNANLDSENPFPNASIKIELIKRKKYSIADKKDETNSHDLVKSTIQLSKKASHKNAKEKPYNQPRSNDRKTQYAKKVINNEFSVNIESSPAKSENKDEKSFWSKLFFGDGV